MYDIRFIREQAERFDRGLINRGAEPLSARLIALDDERRAAITASQTAQEKRNIRRKSAKPWRPKTKLVLIL